MWNIHFKCLSPIALEIIAEQGNPESLWLLLGTYVFLKKILIEVCDFYHLKKIMNQGHVIKSLLGYSIFYSQHLLYLWCSKMFPLYSNNIPWLKPCVKGRLLSVVNLLCYHDYTKTAMNLEQTFKLKIIEKKIHFSSMLMAVTSELEEGLLKSGAQTLSNPWSSAD